MRSVKTILKDIYGLFVDDGSFAFAILVWLLIVWLAFPRLGLRPSWRAAMLVAGLTFIFVKNVMRRRRC